MAIWHMPSFFTQCQFLLHDPDTHISGMYVIQKPIVSMRASTISNPGIYFFSKSSSPIASSKNASMLSLLVILNHCHESPCKWRKMQQSPENLKTNVSSVHWGIKTFFEAVVPISSCTRKIVVSGQFSDFFSLRWRTDFSLFFFFLPWVCSDEEWPLCLLRTYLICWRFWTQTK